MTFLRVRDIVYIKEVVMFECKICGIDLFNPGGLSQHIPKCKRLSLIKDEVIITIC